MKKAPGGPELDPSQGDARKRSLSMMICNMKLESEVEPQNAEIFLLP